MIIRPASSADAADMARVLNAVIAVGGTTAHQTAMSVAEVRQFFVDGPEVFSSVVFEEADRSVGWQSVGQWMGDPHIGSFVQPGLQARGAGARMFALTCDILRARGIGYIIASIRSDNVPGLAYYARIGFRDIAEDPDFTLADGQRVGRVHRRFDL